MSCFRLILPFIFSFSLFITFLQLNGQSKNQEAQLFLREIGNDFLIRLNDSTSWILPIKEIGNRYKMEFQHHFEFNPGLLVSSVEEVLRKYNMETKVIVEVESCSKPQVIYSFKTNLSNNKDLIACKLRTLPLNCYTFYFTLISPTGNSSSYYFILSLFLGGCLVLIILIFSLKRNKHLYLGSQTLIELGKYRFNPDLMVLSHHSTEYELSYKENQLLQLFCSSPNVTLKREYLLNQVWGDEGDYIGRTLDVFISKLRKKLLLDNSVRILNIRGIGYRLVLEN